MKTDVLIVGSGCSALYMALHLPENLNILMVTKKEAELSDSFLAQGGICMLRNEEDYDSYFEDTMKAGHYENDVYSVELMIKSSPDVIQDLISYGVDFERTPARPTASPPACSVCRWKRDRSSSSPSTAWRPSGARRTAIL